MSKYFTHHYYSRRRRTANRLEPSRRCDSRVTSSLARDGSTDALARNRARVERPARARAFDGETGRGGARRSSRIRGADAVCFDRVSIIGTQQEKEEENADVVDRDVVLRERARTSRECDASGARSRFWHERSARGVEVLESARGDAIPGALVLRSSVLA